jgi:aminoglycoside phosphotransferase (APT) family kinase protein
MTQDDPFVHIDVSLVRRLLADQFPQWADLSVRPVAVDGHDNRTFHLGDDMSIRMPSARWYAEHVRTEHTWLPKLASYLPLPIPVPVGRGVPGGGYPWPWSVNMWLQGENASLERITDLSAFAKDLANFLNAFQTIDATEGPSPGQDNFFRGGDLATYDSETRACIEVLKDVIDAEPAISIWELALQAKWHQPPVWIHGDIAVGNLLVQDGRLSAVIDFGQLAVGDPSCDTTIAWTFFSGASRDVFCAELDVDASTWMRGRGWGLWKALLQLRAHRDNNLGEAGRALGVIRDICAVR